ncbi:MAG: GntR family transcriptional regulator [Candidatus Dormibacteria bacterium]
MREIDGWVEGGAADEGAPEAELSPLDTTSLRDRARHAIWASIVAGEVEAGQIYPVAHFTARLGVSATPIREALFDLTGTGIVEVVRNRGFRVPVITDRDLDNLLDLRMMLERPAVVRVAEQNLLGDPSELRELAEAILERARRGDISSFLSADRHFHGELLQRAGNPRLTEIVMNLRDQTRLYGLGHLAESGRLVESARIHVDLLEALERGDGAAADNLMQRHLRHTRGEWAGMSETGEPGTHGPA